MSLMRAVLLILLVTLSLYSHGQVKNPFLSLKFDKVVMYDYEPLGENPALVDKNGQLLPTVKIKKQVQPDAETISEFNRKVGDKKSYGQVSADCFEPHLAVVYYLQNKIVRDVLICMRCNALWADVDIPAHHQDGMSKSFRQFLNRLLIKYNFSHQVADGSMFDK